MSSTSHVGEHLGAVTGVGPGALRLQVGAPFDDYADYAGGQPCHARRRLPPFAMGATDAWHDADFHITDSSLTDARAEFPTAPTPNYSRRDLTY